MPGANDGRRSPVLAIRAPSASAQISALVPETWSGMRSADDDDHRDQREPGSETAGRAQSRCPPHKW